jgi:hypothetical protein
MNASLHLRNMGPVTQRKLKFTDFESGHMTAADQSNVSKACLHDPIYE